MSRPTLWLVLVVALVMAACTTDPPVPSPIPTDAQPVVTPSASSSVAPSVTPAADVDATFDAIEAQVSDIRGLSASKPVDREFITREELRETLTEQFDEETPPELLDANERLYKAFGLIPTDASLRSLSLDLLSGGVAAFYRDDEGKLYVVSPDGEPGASERFYFSHEYDHALQDQNSTIFADQDGVLDETDRILARQAIYEGDASLLMSQWAAANLDQAGLLELLGDAGDPEAQAVMARTPRFMVETLTFPYTTGLGYVGQVQSTGGWPAVNAYFGRMPTSTEQILHPEKYTAGEEPVAVSLPDDLAARLGDGWTVPMLDTFGELQTGIWLREAGVPSATATDAAAGWGGDRLAVMTGPNDTWAVALKTVWDTAADAAEFEGAATTAMEAADGFGQVLPGDGGKNRWVLVASDAATASHVAGVLGLAG